MFNRVSLLIEKVARSLAIIGGFGLLMATLITCLSIVGKLIRRGMIWFGGAEFNPDFLSWVKPILGEEELVQYFVGFSIFCALPWVTYKKAHVSVNLLEPLLIQGKQLGKWFNQLLNLLGSIGLLYISYMILTRQFFLIFRKARGDDPSIFELLLSRDGPALMERMITNGESQILGIPLWGLYIVAEICIGIFFIVALHGVLVELRGFKTLKTNYDEP